MMSCRALFDKKQLKAAQAGNSLCYMIFAGNPGTRKTMASRCTAGNNNSFKQYILSFSFAKRRKR